MPNGGQNSRSLLNMLEDLLWKLVPGFVKPEPESFSGSTHRTELVYRTVFYSDLDSYVDSDVCFGFGFEIDFYVYFSFGRYFVSWFYFEFGNGLDVGLGSEVGFEPDFDVCPGVDLYSGVQ